MLNQLIAGIVLIAISPILLIISIVIIIDDGMPVLFTQKRIGKGNTKFKMYKFRTMKKGTPNVATHQLKNPEQYILKIGRILRKLSLDELPNLINILKGEMVIVGPRPALYNQDELMALRIKYGIEKLKPGLTGWAQINEKNEIRKEEKVKLELEYLNKKTIKLDITIIIKTITIAFISKNKGVAH